MPPPQPLPELWQLENGRRSAACLRPGEWALRREEAVELYSHLQEAIYEIRRLQRLLEEITRRRR